MGYKKSVFRNLAMVTQLGLCILTPILFGIVAGSYIDSRFGTKTILVFLIVGTLGGGRGAYSMAKRLIEQDTRDEEKQKSELIQKVLEDSSAQTVSKPKTKSRIRKESDGADSMTDRRDLR